MTELTARWIETSADAPQTPGVDAPAAQRPDADDLDRHQDEVREKLRRERLVAL